MAVDVLVSGVARTSTAMALTVEDGYINVLCEEGFQLSATNLCQGKL